MSTGYIYFIGTEAGPIKIGWAKNPYERLRKLQTAHYERLELLGAFVVPSPRSFERELHMALDRARLVGEWFLRSPVLPALVMADDLADPETRGLDEYAQRMCLTVASPLRDGFG